MRRIRGGHAAGELLASHGRQCASFFNQLFDSRAIGCDDAAQSADFAKMAHESSGIDIPNHRDAVTLEILLSRFLGAPVRGER